MVRQKNLYKLSLFFTIAVIAFIIFSLAGCNKKGKVKTPDVSHIEMDIEFIRFEKEVMQANGKNYRILLDSLQRTHPAFFQLYVGNILSIPLADSTYNIYDTLYQYMISDKYMLRLFDSVQQLYANMDDVEKDLEHALKYYKYYFPDSALPTFYTYIAPFVYQVVLGDEVIGIELNMFLGQNFSYYSSFAANLPQYLIYRFRRENISVSVMRMLVDGSIPTLGAESSLLDEMITEGKIMYYLDLVLPKVPDSVKIGFSTEQIKWCEKNAAEMWQFFAGEDLLFSKSMNDKQKYIGEAPFSQGMPEESPGRAAIWVGWQIVKQYMRNNPEVTIQQLFNDVNSYEILRKSNYSP